MDILSHGLWGGIIWGRKNRKSFWLSFIFGIAPDFLSFGIFMIIRLLTRGFSHFGRPDGADIPQYVHGLYNITHSYIVFAVCFALAWAIFKRPVWEMFAWAFHIFLDMFTHSTEFFPTPYAWPFNHPVIDGIPWSTPIIFFTDVFFLALIYLVYFVRKWRHARRDTI
jgi:hypothetical protein